MFVSEDEHSMKWATYLVADSSLVAATDHPVVRDRW